MGTNGIDPQVALREREKCKVVPNKLIYKNSEEAWAKAIERSRETHLKIVPYACDGCGWFHLTSSDKVMDKVVPAQVGISTSTIKRKNPVSTPAIPIRKDMTEHGPTVIGNFEAGVKTLQSFLKGKKSVTKEEILEALPGVSKNSITRYMKRVGWYNTRGRNPVWKPESEKKTNQPIVPITSKKKVIVPNDQDILESVKRHPAGAGVNDFPKAIENHNLRKEAEAIEVLWKTMNLDKIKDMTITELLKTLEMVGLELRVQASFKDE